MRCARFDVSKDLQEQFQVKRFYVSETMAGGSLEEALRVCRLCYVKAEGGTGVEELKRYRAQLVKRM